MHAAPLADPPLISPFLVAVQVAAIPGVELILIFMEQPGDTVDLTPGVCGVIQLDLVLTSDAYDYIFDSKPGDDSATVERTGVEFRPIVDTWRDTFRWMLEQDLVPAERLGVLAD